MLGRRTTGAGFKQATAIQQRHNGEHLGRGAEFHDREQIRQIITQHIPGDGNGIQALADTVERELHRLNRFQDADIEPGSVVILQVFLNLLDQLSIMGALGIQPEDSRRIAEPRAAHGKLHPILDRRILHLAHAEDIAGLNRP